MPLFRLGLLALLFVSLSASAQTRGWQVNEGPSARHSFGRTIANGDNQGFLSGAQIPAQDAAGWSSASSDWSLQWSGPGGTPCRSQANYTYFQTFLQPEPGMGYEVAFTSVDDAAQVSTIVGTGTATIPEFVGLREQKVIDITPALDAGVVNRVVVTLADVCGAGNGIRAELRSVPGGGEVMADEMMEDEPMTIRVVPASLPLSGGQTLQRGQRYMSASGSHYVVFQEDGNLVVYAASGEPSWAFQSVGVEDYGRVARVEMQADGNLAAYDADGGYVWSALSANPAPGSQLTLSSSGALQVVSGSRGVTWSSDGNTGAAPAAAPAAGASAGFPSGPFLLKTQDRGADECLEGNGPDSPVHDGAAFMNTCRPATGQIWSATSVGEGYFVLTSQDHGNDRALESNQSGAPLHNGGAFMDTAQNVTGQQWRAVPAGNGFFKLQSRWRGDGECLEGNGSASPVHGGASFMDRCQNVSGQLWQFVPR